MAADCGSRNGSRVNGRRILEPHSLQPGDVLRLGNSLLVYIHSPSEETEPNPLASSLVGSSEAMRKVRRTIAAVAAHQTSVLIAGETGTGKEVAAQALHDLSGRKGPFVAINCGAVSGGVLESELFGHARGAFTGAVGSRHGLFREADGGTLFLDEVAELSPACQTKLLRALQEGEVRPVGGSAAIKVDARLVAHVAAVEDERGDGEPAALERAHDGREASVLLLEEQDGAHARVADRLVALLIPLSSPPIVCRAHATRNERMS